MNRWLTLALTALLLPTPPLAADDDADGGQAAAIRQSQALHDASVQTGPYDTALKAAKAAPGVALTWEKAAEQALALAKGVNDPSLSWAWSCKGLQHVDRARHLKAADANLTKLESELDLIQAQAARAKSRQAALGGREGLWAAAALEHLDRSLATMPSPSATALRADLLKERRARRWAPDLDLLEIGASNVGPYGDVLPWRMAWAGPGLALVVHTAGLRILWDSTSWSTGGLAQRDVRAALSPIELELDKRLWQWAATDAFPLYPPYYGRGASLALALRACPWSLGEAWPMNDQGPQSVQPNFNVPWAWGQVYETGLKLDTRLLEFSGGYGWYEFQAHLGAQAYPPRGFDGWFYRMSIKLF
jgi:hypothetical protein